jgi:hypothetical protein
VFRMALRKCLKNWYKVGHMKRQVPVVVKAVAGDVKLRRMHTLFAARYM